MRGGSQAHLMRASDNNFYVVKFVNSPQGVRVLANELLATRLARSLGLPMAEAHIIEVPAELIQDSPELRMEIAGSVRQCAAGLQLGSRYVADLRRQLILDHLPDTMFHKVVNRHEFARILPFDKWAGNCDGRQAVFTKRPDERKYHAIFIDQGYCFNADEWSFPDLPLLGTYHSPHVYHDVTGWHSFEPVLSHIEQIDYADLWQCGAQIPHAWFEHDGQGLFDLMETLYKRRFLVRERITQFRNSSRHPFPQWAGTSVIPLSGIGKLPQYEDLA